MTTLDTTKPRDAHIDERLRTEPMIWLSTVRPDGRPHIVPVWFYWDGESIYIFSQPNTQKLRNLQHNNHVMLGLDMARQGGDIVMVEGKATLPEDKTHSMDLPGFVQKYADLITRLGYSPEAMAQAYSEVIRITPTKFMGHGE